jgi:tRNA(Glu) U13 pseudouridine synthase TruD
LIRQFPEISVEGSERDTFVNVKNFKYRYENDELNNGKFKCILEFSLPKGAYGTIVVKELFG